MLGVIDRRVMRAVCLIGVVVLLVLLGVCGVAGAVTPGPAWSVQSIAGPTNFVPGSGEVQSYRVYVTNAGSRATDGSPVAVADMLPPGVTSGYVNVTDFRVGGFEGGSNCGNPCVYRGVMQPGDTLLLEFRVSVSVSAVEGPVTNRVVVSGGGAGAV